MILSSAGLSLGGWPVKCPETGSGLRDVETCSPYDVTANRKFDIRPVLFFFFLIIITFARELVLFKYLIMPLHSLADFVIVGCVKTEIYDLILTAAIP